MRSCRIFIINSMGVYTLVANQVHHGSHALDFGMGAMITIIMRASFMFPAQLFAVDEVQAVDKSVMPCSALALCQKDGTRWAKTFETSTKGCHFTSTKAQKGVYLHQEEPEGHHAIFGYQGQGGQSQEDADTDFGIDLGMATQKSAERIHADRRKDFGSQCFDDRPQRAPNRHQPYDSIVYVKYTSLF